MRVAALLVAILSAGAAHAETVVVQTGEHEGFSRIVLDLAQATPWQLGRTRDGYQLRLGRDDVRFDLSKVFDKIPRTRLAAIWADPETGDLLLGVGCACHAQPFEFRDDIIVIDIKDGPPPRGSSFETTLAGAQMPILAGQPPMRPRTRPSTANNLPDGGSDWAQRFPESQTPPLALPPAEVQQMREALLLQLSQGASQGLVDMAMPPRPASGKKAEGPQPHVREPAPRVQLSTSFGPGMAVQMAREPDPDLTSKGKVCIENARLEVITWADDRPFMDQLAEIRAFAVGEFDRPDTDVVMRQTRLLLYFGFGAEARETLAAFAFESPDLSLWKAMAAIVDGDPVGADNPFAGQADCDTHAALWSVLSETTLRLSDRAKVPAVLRAFSGLPVELRRLLGPGLAERFLSIDDASSARSVRDAMRRAPGDPGDAALLAEARIDLHDGRPDDAAVQIESVANDGGPMLPEALIDLVDVRLAQGAAVDPETITALSALANEQKDGPLGPKLRRAEGLALASAGDFVSAFAIANAGNSSFEAELWPLLASSGPDSALLTRAVLPEGSVPPTDPETGTIMARRLIALGFPDAGLAWLPRPEGNTERTLLAATAELSRRDARGALRVLAGETGPEAERLRAQAQLQLGDTVGASTAFAAAGDTAAAERALWQGQDWAAIAASETDPVRSVAATFALSDVIPPGATELPSEQSDIRTTTDPVVEVLGTELPTTLARGRALIEDSTAARTAIAELLDAVPGPAAPGP